jgi:hypothetical protein
MGSVTVTGMSTQVVFTWILYPDGGCETLGDCAQTSPAQRMERIKKPRCTILARASTSLTQVLCFGNTCVLLKEEQMGLIRDFIFIVLFFVLLFAWLIAWLAFHVAGGMIHLLLIIAVIALILHFVRRRSV